MQFGCFINKAFFYRNARISISRSLYTTCNYCCLPEWPEIFLNSFLFTVVIFFLQSRAHVNHKLYNSVQFKNTLYITKGNYMILWLMSSKYLQRVAVDADDLRMLPAGQLWGTAVQHPSSGTPHTMPPHSTSQSAYRLLSSWSFRVFWFFCHYKLYTAHCSLFLY